MKLPVPSTYCSDPNVTHYVESSHPTDGSGIQGWFISEADASYVAEFLNGRGHAAVKVCPIANLPKGTGIHHLIEVN